MKTPAQEYLFELHMLLETAVSRDASRTETAAIHGAIKLAKDLSTVDKERQSIVNAWLDCYIKTQFVTKQPTKSQMLILIEQANEYYNQTYPQKQS